MTRRSLALLALLVSACSAGPPMLDAGADACVGCADDPCDPSPCADPDSVCVAEGEAARCECAPGFHAVGAACEPDERCMSETCGGHGACAMSEGGLSCACDDGYAGEFCEGCDVAMGYLPDGRGGCSLDPCEPSPCGEPGRERCEATEEGPQCLCNAGTHDEGGDCVPDEMCTETTCSGRGACSESASGLLCDCDAGFDGLRCEACDETAGYHEDGMGGCTMDLCVPNPCIEPGRTVCVAEGADTRCECDPGTHDAAGACVPDETCAADSCGHGSCAVVGGVRACTCELGWAGPTCDACDAAAGYHDDGVGGCTTDACLPSPCTMPNRSVCAVVGGSATCACDPGYHDDGVGGCTTDPCRPDPCAASDMACRVGDDGAAECYTPVCDDDNPCTDDSVVGGVCVFSAVTDGTSCSTSICISGQTCGGGTCGGGSPVSCDDSNPCTADSCADPTGCANVIDDSATPDDGVACTTDGCTAGAAWHTPADTACDDALYCNGVETCAPLDASAGADGCVRSAPPGPPGPSSPCRYYGACDEATDSFPLVTLGAGASCDDGLSCTTGDQCRSAGGACAGTLVDGCIGAACSSTSPLPGTIDIPTASISGAITLDGAAIPATAASTGGHDVRIYARAHDTGNLHLLQVVEYDYDSSGVYPLRAGTDAISTRLVPGTYDVLYRRGLPSDGSYVFETHPSDPFAHGDRVLGACYSVSPR